MEVLIILIAIGIIGYVIYQNLPSSKLALASNLIAQGKLHEAEIILVKILNKHTKAPAKLAQCFYNRGLKEKIQNNYSSFEKVLDLKKQLKGFYNHDFALIEAESYYEIADRNYTAAWKLASTYPLESVKELKENILFINMSTKFGIEEKFTNLRDYHTLKICEIYFEEGKKLEIKGQYLDAINNYNEAIAIHSSKSKSKTQNYYDNIARREICKIKIGDIQDYQKHSSILIEVNSANTRFKTDFYYRYILKLCNKNNALAEELTTKYLPIDNPITDKLIYYFESFKKKIAIEQIYKINSDLEDLFNSQFPIDKTKSFYSSLDKSIPSIVSVYPDLKQKLEEIKPSLFNKLLISSIENHDYNHAIELIIGFPNFWTIPELLKNLGICCFGITNQQKLTVNNYELVISSWLTAVYSDEVILKSLDSTSWDDEYTFTLKESIGSKYGNHSNIPDNTNYKDISDSNISIGATQRELLSQFESAINKQEEESLSKKLHLFYDNEKIAIEKVIEVIVSQVIFAGPYFAKKFSSVGKEIISELNYDYLKYANIEALEAGVAYFDSTSSQMLSTSVGEYYEATMIRKELLYALNSLQTDKLIEIKNNPEKKTLINKFDEFRESLEDDIFNFFNTKIEEDDENDKLIAPLAQSINLFNTASKLRYQYSNFVTNLTIAKVNADKMDNYAALQNLRNAYLCKMDITRVCKNLIAIIRINLFDIINDRTNKSIEIYKILDEIKNKKSTIYKNNCSELTKARRDILTQFHADTRALILSGNNLNAEGHKIREALKYLAEMGDEED
jgi:hypothetical protein